MSVRFCCCCLCLCSKKQGYDHLPFIMSLGKEVSGQGIWSALTNHLIFRGNLFRVHGSYGTVFFINRYMYFCVVAFLNDKITQSFSCLPLNFSFLQIYIKTVLHVCFFLFELVIGLFQEGFFFLPIISNHAGSFGIVCSCFLRQNSPKNHNEGKRHFLYVISCISCVVSQRR